MSRATHTRAVVAMSLGGLLFGFDTAVISGVTDGLPSRSEPTQEPKVQNPSSGGVTSG